MYFVTWLERNTEDAFTRRVECYSDKDNALFEYQVLRKGLGVTCQDVCLYEGKYIPVEILERN